MTQRSLVLTGLFAMGLSSCAGSEPTRAGDPGHWALTKYLVRVYRVPRETTVQAAKKFVLDNGYSINREEQLTKESMIHGLKASKLDFGPSTRPQKPQSIIIRTDDRGDGITRVRMKVGPLYLESETRAMFDEYQKLLPASAQPR